MTAPFSEEHERRALMEEIFRTHFTAVHHYIFRQVQQPDLADDLTSVVFIKAIRWLREDRGVLSVRSWLYATARTTIAEYWQEQQKGVSFPLEMIKDISTIPAEKGNVKRTQEWVKLLLHLLSEREHQVLFLRYFRGYSAAEIGQELGMNTGHVRVLHLRALRHAALLKVQKRSLLFMNEPIMTYTQQGQRVLDLAKEEALSLDQHYLGAEHLLLGILREGSVTAPILAPIVEQWATLERVRAGVIFMVGRGQPASGENTPFNPHAQQVLTRAGEAARDRGERAISPSHILHALAYEEYGLKDELLHSLGVRGSSPGSVNIPPLNESEMEHYVQRIELRIEQTPVLSEEEEMRLAHLVAYGRAESLKQVPDPLTIEEGNAAYFQLNPASQHLVLSIAREYNSPGRDLRKLMLAGNGGLALAIITFGKKQISFRSYAMHLIHLKIMETFDE